MALETQISKEMLSRLRQLLVDHFNEKELRTLCFDLRVNYDALPAVGTAGKARELIASLERNDRIPDLLQVGQRLRPEVDWSQTYLDDRMADYRAQRDRADQLRRALEITSAAGVVGDAIRDLELIRKAGIEGLEPVFELLEGILREKNAH